MQAEDILKEAAFTGAALYAEPMSRHTSLGIGGPAEAMAFPEDVEGLSRLLTAAHKRGVDVFILGNGTNLLVRDGGIKGLVINLSKMDWIIKEQPEQGRFTVRAGAGAPLPKLVNFCVGEGMSGLEFAAGIPGTVGGAVFMNAGAYGREIKDALYKIRLVMEDGMVSEINAEGLGKGYRHGGIPANSCVSEVWFTLTHGDKEEMKGRVSEFMGKRRATQPLSSKSAGSTFKNPPGLKAWKIINEAGLKGTRVGGAMVSEKHANFLINAGGATARDFTGLMALVVDTVREKLNITLEPEIKIVGMEAK